MDAGPDVMSPCLPPLVIVGAGIAGCALAARLRQLGWRGPLTLVEAGRGAGGRASSRRSRHDPSWVLDHGAPFLNLTDPAPPALLGPLLATGRLRPWPEREAPLQVLGEDHSLQPGPGPFAQGGRLLRGWPAMADLAEGMLALAEAARDPGGPAVGAPPLVRRQGTRVVGLERRDGHWHLRDGAGTTVASAPWLVLSGNLLAHPRGRELLGVSEVPLAVAARPLADGQLNRALAAVATLRYEPRLALLLRLEAPRAAAWRALPFRHLTLGAEARRRWGLERITVQPLSDGRCGVVAQARPCDLDSCGLLARGQAGAPATADRHELEALGQALLASLAPWICPGDLADASGQQRMRWGGAFPLPPGLDREAMVCPRSGVALCGDAIVGAGLGRIEGAWRSGEWLAERLWPELMAH